MNDAGSILMTGAAVAYANSDSYPSIREVDLAQDAAILDRVAEALFVRYNVGIVQWPTAGAQETYMTPAYCYEQAADFVKVRRALIDAARAGGQS